jgi:hypothetical protein
MRFTETPVTTGKEILYNDHYVGIPYDCTSLSALATNGVIPAGTLIPSNDGEAEGVLLHDVVLADNPNGTIVIHGFIRQEVLPTAPTQTAVNALNGKGVQFVDAYGKPQIQKYTVTYDKGAAVSGTVPTDSSSPYAYGSTVTAKTNSGSLVGPTGTTTFDKWNTKADGSGTEIAANATFTITDNTVLYAQFKA